MGKYYVMRSCRVGRGRAQEIIGNRHRRISMKDLMEDKVLDFALAREAAVQCGSFRLDTTEYMLYYARTDDEEHNLPEDGREFTPTTV